MTRKEAIIDIRDNIKPVVGGKSLDMAIEALEQEPKTGKWLIHSEYDTIECNRCFSLYSEYEDFNYCPNCGAKMVEP